jgi:hypothetical protein
VDDETFVDPQGHLHDLANVGFVVDIEDGLQLRSIHRVLCDRRAQSATWNIFRVGRRPHCGWCAAIAMVRRDFGGSYTRQ